MNLQDYKISYISFLKELSKSVVIKKKKLKNFYHNILIHEYFHSKIYDKFKIYNYIEFGYDHISKKYDFEAYCIGGYSLDYILPKKYLKWFFIESIQFIYDLLFDLFCQFTFHKYFFWRIKRFLSSFNELIGFNKKYCKIKKKLKLRGKSYGI